jgi:hypothetical protein
VRRHPDQTVKGVAGAVLQRNFDTHLLIASQAPQSRSPARFSGRPAASGRR